MMSRRQVTDTITLVLFAIAALLAGIAAAGTEHHRQMLTVIDKDDGMPVISTRFDGQELGYDPFAPVDGQHQRIVIRRERGVEAKQ